MRPYAQRVFVGSPVGVRTALRAAALALVTCMAAANLPAKQSPSLVVVTPGIMDEASNAWVGIASTLAPTKDRWVIRQEGVVGKEDLSHVPQNHIITVRTNATSEEIRRLVGQSGIAQSRNATVIVDMDLNSVNVPVVNKDAWAKPTQWTGRVVEALADEQLKVHPDSRTMWIGHSAGTEPMTMVRQKSESGDRPLFNDIYAMSARRFDTEYPKNTVMVFADHDFLASPKGDVPMGSITGSFGERDAVALAKMGYPVVRIAAEGSGSSSALSAAGSEIMKMLEGPAVAVVAEYKERKGAHSEAHDVSYPDRRMVYYAPNSADQTPIPTGSLGRALKVVSDVNDGRAKDISAAVKALGHDEPTKGIGGISLNATAYLPVDPKDVESAAFSPDEGRLVLTMTDGSEIRLPAMEPEVVRQAYDTAYVNDEKAELSISSNRAQDPGGNWVSNLGGPGDFSVYYFGHSEDTQLGLVMFEADHRLGEFAFENPSQNPNLLPRFPGFRSLPELFPEKYTDHPSNNDYGRSLRVFLTTSSVTLRFSANPQELDFDDTTFAVHFGATSPAEAAFAAFFESHFDQIASTEPGRPFAQLVPYARAIAIFRWLKANEVSVDTDGIEDIAVAKVFTPTAVPIHKPIAIDDIAPPLPTVFFGVNGPIRVIRADGAETTIRYSEGLLQEVRRYDGAVLNVFRDSLGSAIGMSWTERKAVAFVQDPGHGLIYAKGVDLSGIGDELAVKYGSGSSFFPASNSEKILASVALRFANGQEP